MLSPDEIRAINENYRQDFNRHDADALQNYYAESILWTNSSVEGEVTDPKEVSKQYEYFFINSSNNIIENYTKGVIEFFIYKIYWKRF